MELQWESSSSGQKAMLVPRRTIDGPVLGGIASSMANDIVWVRATFRGVSTGFEPYVRLWITQKRGAKGLTVLLNRYPMDAPSDAVPDVCIRSTEWNEGPAVQGFIEAVNKRLYVQNELPVKSVLRFYRSSELDIKSLMELTSRLVAVGPHFVHVRRPELDQHQVTVEFCDGSLFSHFSFGLGTHSSDELEDIIRRWSELSESLPIIPDTPPDCGFQVAYRESIWEQVAKYEG